MRSRVVAGWIAAALTAIAPGARADEAEYVAEMLAQLRDTMGVAATDPDYCAKSRDLCRAMCLRFLEEGIVTGSCESHCAAAHAQSCAEEQ